jgi:CRP-like cAMP-binding protein
MKSGPPNDAALRRNRLLSLLDDTSLSALAPHLELVPLPVPKSLYGEGKAMRHVYFPIEGVVSMLAPVQGVGRRIEVGTIGREGMAGLSVFFGAKQATGDTFMQVGGEGWQMPSAAFLDVAHASARLTHVLHAYAQTFFVQISQALACNSTHSPEQRCARWLLMTQDRVSSDTFLLRQEFLAQMLGERRVTVSRAASKLRERGLIAYSRGVIAIRDRERLEEEACQCYEIIRSQYETMLQH